MDHSPTYKGSPLSSLPLPPIWVVLHFLPRPGFLLLSTTDGRATDGRAFSMPPQPPLREHIKTHLFVLIMVSWSQGQGLFLTQLCLLRVVSARTCKWQMYQKCFLNWTASLVSLEDPLSTGVLKPRLTTNYWTWWIEAPSNCTQKYNITELKPIEIWTALIKSILLKKLPQKKLAKFQI